MIARYLLITDTKQSDFEDSVNECIDDGYQPYGNPFSGSFGHSEDMDFVYCQAMVLKKEDKSLVDIADAIHRLANVVEAKVGESF